jgi:hypothetical protein
MKAAMRGLQGALLLQERGLSAAAAAATAGGWGDAAALAALGPLRGDRGELLPPSAIFACSLDATSCDAFSAADGHARRIPSSRALAGADAAGIIVATVQLSPGAWITALLPSRSNLLSQIDGESSRSRGCEEPPPTAAAAAAASLRI